MRSKLPWALFAVSLALNIFFVGGVLYSELAQRDGDSVSDARIAAITEELGLTEAERAGLVELRARMRERWQAMRRESEPARDSLVEALLEPTLDRQRALTLIHQRYEPRHRTIAESMIDLHGYLAILDEEQRRDFVEMAKEPSFFRELFGRARK